MGERKTELKPIGAPAPSRGHLKNDEGVISSCNTLIQRFSYIEGDCEIEVCGTGDTEEERHIDALRNVDLNEC